MDIVGCTRRILVFVCLIVLLVSNIVISSAFSATQHGCAPATPPPVAGTLTQPEAIGHAVFINEVLPSPVSVWNCSEQGTSPTPKDIWVELYNPQNQALDLYGAHSNLDTGPNTTRSYFPMGSAIAAHGFLVIFPLEFAPLAFIPPSFSTLRLLFGDTLIDQVSLVPLVSDTSYARMPDGGDIWQVTDAPTIDTSNVPPTPTPTPTPIRTPKPSSTKTDSQKSSTQSKTSTLDRANTDTSNQAAGTQPTWNTLSVPTTTSSASGTTTLSNISNSAPQATTNADLPQKILLTSLAVVSLFALLWVSRFFRRAKNLSGTPTQAPPIQENDDFSVETTSLPTIPDNDPPNERK